MCVRNKSTDRNENCQRAKVNIRLNSIRTVRMEEMDVDDRDSLINIEVSSSPAPSRSTNIYGSPIARRVGQNESGEAIASTSVAFPSVDSDRVVRSEIIFCLLTV